MTNDKLERQLKVAGDVNVQADANKAAILGSSNSIEELICTVCFTCNVEQEAATTLINSYLKQKPDTTDEQILKLFKDESKRAMMFRTLYARKHAGVNKDKLKSLYTSIPLTMNFDEYTKAVDSQLGRASGTDSGFFTVIDKDKDGPDSGTNTDLVESFRKRALKEGLPEDLIASAVAKADTSTTNYSKFEELIDEVLNENQAKEDEQRARDVRLKRALQPTLQKLWADKNPVGTLRNAIWKQYHTTAVSVPELCEKLKDDPNLKLTVYEKPIYSIIHQIDKPFVEQAVKECLANWSNNPVVNGIIENYLESTGVNPDGMEAGRAKLISILPDNIKNQNAPDVWKQYKAVTLILDRNSGGDADLTAELFADENAVVEFGARVESYMEDGAPFDAAQRQASEDFYHSLPKEKQESLFGKVGKFYGKALKFKYDRAADMDNLLRESLGEYADQYFDRRDAMRERKEELRYAKAEQKAEIKKQQVEERKQQNEVKRELRAEQNAQVRNATAQPVRRAVNDPRFSTGAAAYTAPRQQGVNFAPQIPVFVMAILIHLVVGLLTFIIFGGLKTAFVIVGLALATFGFIRKQVDEPNSIPMIALGYVITVIAFIFT